LLTFTSRVVQYDPDHLTLFAQYKAVIFLLCPVSHLVITKQREVVKKVVLNH
jgi:hypothetical protein